MIVKTRIKAEIVKKAFFLVSILPSLCQWWMFYSLYINF
jgi:hypothetical protein